MTPEAPGSNGGDPEPADDPMGQFDALVERAEAAGARGRARAAASGAAVAAVAAPKGSSRRFLVLLLVLVAVLAGALIGWVARGDDPDRIEATPAAPSTTAAVSSTSADVSTTLEPAAPATPAPALGTPSTVVTPPDLEPVKPAGADGDPSAAPAMHHTVLRGESFWSIAEEEVARMTSEAPSDAQVATYWRALMAANADELVQPGNPNLVYPGQVFELPPMAGP